MPIAVFLISGALTGAVTGALTTLAIFCTPTIRQEYRNRQERKRLRQGLAERISRHHGVPFEDIKPGKHRLDDSGAAHELCTDNHPCAHRGEQNGMVHAEFYLERAKREQQAALEAEREAMERIPWPREEDAWAGDQFSGLLCGYRTPSNLPELSTPVGLRGDLTAASASMPREPASVGR